MACSLPERSLRWVENTRLMMLKIHSIHFIQEVGVWDQYFAKNIRLYVNWSLFYTNYQKLLYEKIQVWKKIEQDFQFKNHNVYIAVQNKIGHLWWKQNVETPYTINIPFFHSKININSSLSFIHPFPKEIKDFFHVTCAEDFQVSAIF